MMPMAEQDSAARTAVRVLVVEDERIVAQHIRMQLTKLGYTVTGVAATGRQVLDQVRSAPPDVILMDINIEGDMDGIETAAALPGDTPLPVIYLTAYSEESTLRRARETAPYGYLLKPFTERELHATIQMTLERRAVEDALAASEERLGLALAAAEMGTWELDPASSRLHRQGLADRIFGITPEVFSDSWTALLDLVGEGDRPRVADAFEAAVLGRDLVRIEFRTVHHGASGQPRWLRMQGKAFRSGDGTRVVGVVQDITEKRHADDRLRQAATVLEASQNGIFILDGGFRVITANPACQEITGYDLDALAGRTPRFLEPPKNRQGDPDALADMRSGLESSERWSGEVWGYGRGGRRIPLLLSITAVRDDGARAAQYVGTFSDLTPVKRAEEQAQYLAYYDALTDLPNRQLALDRLDHALQRCDGETDCVGVISIDLDYFKRINETLGHAMGDSLLCAAAHRMQGTLRPEDTFARMGADEFLVIIEEDSGENSVGGLATTARTLLAAAGHPVEIDGRKLIISATAGISLYPEDGTTATDLVRAAGTAMSTAKRNGRNTIAFYAPEMTARAVSLMTLEQDLRRALDNDELVLHYQPQRCLADDSVSGFEALVRWRHPRHGLLGADHVVPIAESSGLIEMVGQWVLEEACRQMTVWRQAGLRLPRVSVNASVHQMRRQRLLDIIGRVLDRTALPPEALEIEITESALQDEADCLATLSGLRDLGVSRALDDFGTGYSSLGSLKTLPIDRLKIDQGFVRGVPHDGGDAAIVETVIAMAHRLNLQVTAEGVETPVQRQFLEHHGCDEIQGFLYGRPVPADAAAVHLGRQ